MTPVASTAPRVWFVAAGTGGHIFPGLAVAKELKHLRPNADVLFFGTQNRLEARLVPEAGYPLATLAAAPWKGRGIFSRFGALFSLGMGFFQVLGRVLKDRPSALVSVGGYVSVPVALACRLRGVPLVILEPNIRAGLANRMLSRIARLAYCAPGADALSVFRCPVSDAGNPVREGLAEVPVRPQVFKIFVLGGSQGAAALCRAGLHLARDLQFRAKGLKLVIQSGQAYYDESLALRAKLGLEDCVEILPFIQDVPTALREADLVIARAGAMTVTELAIMGLPTVFVPFPHAADDHQRKNAGLLVTAGAARMVDERDGEFEPRLQASVAALLDSRTERESLHAAFLKFGRPHATQTIVRGVLEVIGDPA